jgi:hypothetical protein
MKSSIKHSAGFCLIGAVLVWPLAVQASLTVNRGWDLLRTDPSSTADGVHWQGVSIGAYDFGGSIGVQNVGDTDTIIHRTADAAASAYGSWVDNVPVSIEALQLRSVDQVNLGAGLGYYYVTLQSLRGGSVSSGTMSISLARKEIHMAPGALP